MVKLGQLTLQPLKLSEFACEKYLHDLQRGTSGTLTSLDYLRLLHLTKALQQSN